MKLGTQWKKNLIRARARKYFPVFNAHNISMKQKKYFHPTSTTFQRKNQKSRKEWLDHHHQYIMDDGLKLHFYDSFAYLGEIIDF